jgi:hypothetical protein
VDAVILECADHLETGPVPDVREPWIPVPAEVALENAAVGGPIEQRSPRLELAHARGSLLRVQLGHAPIVEVLAAAHRIREMHPPAVAVIDVRHRRGDTPFGHHRVRLAEQRLADDADAGARARGLDCRA